MLEDGEFRILMESLETYLDDNNIDKLLQLAKKYNKFDLLNSRVIELEEYKQDKVF